MLVRGRLQGKPWAGSGSWLMERYAGGGGLSLSPSTWSPPPTPANRLIAFRHFPHLLSRGFCSLLHHVLPFGVGDGGRGRSPQCLKGSGEILLREALTQQSVVGEEEEGTKLSLWGWSHC